MSTVKRLQHLIGQLDVSEGGGTDAALATAGPSGSTSELDELMAQLKELGGSSGSPQPGQQQQAVSLQHVPQQQARNMQPHPNRQSSDGEDDDNASTLTEDTDQGAGRGPTRGYGERYAYLERRALQLMSDNKALALTLETTSRQKDLQIQELQAQLAKVVGELAERQKAVEARAPLLRLRVDDLRDQLRDLRVSDARYAELKTMPQDSLHVVDHVKMAVYEEVSGLRKENERLRLAIGSARDTASRAEEEAARLRVESARASAAMVDKEKDLTMVADGLQARVERLASELESALVRAELLSAKGQMYDELKARADKLQEDNHRLQVVEANFKRLEEQSRELQLFAKDKEHHNSMLLSDKAYLSQQVEFLQDAQRRLQSEVESRDAKVAELQRGKQELFDKLLKAETLKSRQEESTLQRELAQLQSGTQASIERIRTETAEAYEREARLLRELRDQAQEDAARAKTAHSALQAEYEQLQLNTAELQRKLESQIVELQAELKHKAFEVSHLNVVVGEKEGLLHRANMQLELLQDKLQVSLDQYRTLESEMRAAAAAGLSMPPTLMMPRLAAALPAPTAAGAAAAGARAQPGAAVPQQAAGSAVGGVDAVLGELRAQAKVLQNENDELKAQVQSLQAGLKSSQATLQLAGQPHAFLLQQLQTAKTAAQQADVRVVAVTAALKAKEQEAASLAAERDALRVDLEALLQHRGQLQGLKALLLKTLGAPAPLAATGTGPLGPAATGSLGPTGTIRPAARPPATTIIGEGP